MKETLQKIVKGIGIALMQCACLHAVAAPKPSTGTAAIAGTGNVCIGSTSTLTDVSTGGSWWSGNTSVATVNLTTGVVSGIAEGTAVISYIATSTVTTVVTVNAVPAATIATTGNCPGATLTGTSSLAYSSVAWSNGGTVTGLGGSAYSTAVAIASGDGIQYPTGMYMASNGDLYICDYLGGKVWKYAAGFTSSTHGTVVAQTGINYPWAVTMDASGNLYVTSDYYGQGKIVKYPAGSTASTAGVTIVPTNPYFFYQMVIDASGNLFVAEAGNGVWKYAAGTWTGTQVVSTLYAIGVYLRGSDTLYVSDNNLNEVLKYTPTGGSTYSAGVVVAGNGTAGSELNQLNNIGNVILDKNGYIFVADYGNGRVMRFPPNSAAGSAGIAIGSGVANYTCLTDTLGNLYIPNASGGQTLEYSPLFLTSASYTATAPGNYTATFTTPAGCSVTTGAITINPAPGAIAGASAVCAGSAITLGDTSAGTWSSGNTALATVDATGIVTGIAAGSLNISYTSPLGCPAIKSILVNPLPFVSLNTTSHAPGAVLTEMSVPAATSVLWNLNGSAVSAVTITGGDPYGPAYYVGTSDGLVQAAGIFVKPGGDMYVTDNSGNKVFKYAAGSSSGTIVAQAGVSAPWGVTTDAAGNLYVANSYAAQIMKYPPNSDATTEGTIIITGTGVFYDIALDPSGNLFVAEGPNGIWEYPAGSSTGSMIIASPNAWGVYVDAYDTVYVADENNNNITKYAPSVSGYVSGTVVAGSGYSSGLNGFAGVSGVTVDKAGNIYAADINNQRVLKFPPNSTAATYGEVVGSSYNYNVGVDAYGNLYEPDAYYSRIEINNSTFPASASYTASAPGSYTAIASTPLGCSATSNAVAIGISISGATTVCVGGTALLTPSIAGGSWYSGNPDGASVDVTSGVVTGLAPGTVVISFVSNLGVSATWSMTVTAAPAITAISSGTAACAGNTVNFSDTVSGAGTLAYSWSGPASFSSSLQNPSIPSATTAANGTYTLAVTDSNGCKATAGTTVSLNPVPAVSLTDSSACPGSSIVVSSSLSYDHVTWMAGTTTVKTTVNNAALSVSYIGAGALSGPFSVVSVPNGDLYVGDYYGSKIVKYPAGYTSSTVGTVVLSDVSPISISVDTAGNLYTIFYNAGNTAIGKFAPGSTTPAVVAQNGIASSFVSGIALDPVGNLFVTDYSNSRILEYPVGSDATTTPIVVASLGADVGYQLYVDPHDTIYMPLITANKVMKYAPAGTGAYSEGVVFAGGSGDFSLLQPTGVWGDNKGSIYVGSVGNSVVVKYPLNAGGAPGVTIITDILNGWSGCFDAAGNMYVADASDQRVNKYTPAVDTTDTLVTTAGGSYTATVTTAAGCSATAGPVAINTMGVITGPAAVCAGASIILGDTTAGGTWSGGGEIASINASTGVVTGLYPGTVVFTYTSAAGCNATYTVTVNAAPGAIAGAGTIYIGDHLTLSDATTGGTWASGNTSVATIDAASGVVTGVSGGTAMITYSSVAGCTITAVVTVNGIQPISGASVVCLGTSAAFTSIATGGTWVSSNSSVATVSLTGIVSGVTVGTAIISYRVTADSALTKTISVGTLPPVITGTLKVCPGTSTSLADSGPGGAWTLSNTGIASIDADGTLHGLAAGYTTVSYAIGGGCPRTAIMTVNPLPSIIAGPLGICAGTTTTLNATPTNGTWTSGNTEVATIATTTHALTGVTAGLSAITYTLPSGCLITATATVNPNPAPVSGMAQVCAGAGITLTNATPGGTWTSGNTTIATVDAVAGSVSGISAGTANITYMLTTGCKASGMITVNPLPAAISGSGAACVGLTTALTDATTGGSWTSLNTSVATIGSTGIVSGVSPGTATISYTFGTGCGGSGIVTINALPSAITGTATVCIGAATTLANATAGGTWSSASSNVAIYPATGVVSGVTAGTAVVTYTLPAGCMATTTVTINGAPAIISGTASVCVGLTTTLADATTGGTWSTADAAASIDAASGIVTGISAGTAVVTYTSVFGCVRTAPVVVNGTPAPIMGTTLLCAGTTSTLTDATTPGMSWTSSNTAIATVGAGSGVVAGVAVGSAVITYKAGTGCTTTTMVSVNALPSAISGTMKVCAGLSTSLADATAGGTWSATTMTGTIDASTGLFSSVAAGTATVTYTSPAGCITTATVTVNALPAAIAGPGITCAGATTALTDAGGGTWSSSNTGIATVALTSGVVTGVAAGTSNITYTLSTTGCSVTSVVTVSGLPSASTGTATVCAGSTTTLSNAVSGGTWSSANTTIATVDAASGVVTGVTAGTVNITYSSAAGCIVHNVVTVTALPSGIAGSLSVCAGNTTALGNTLTGGTWSSGNTGIATIGLSSGIVTGVSQGTTSVTYTVASGCSATAVVTVNTIPSISGTISICAGATTSLTNSAPGGTWSSSTVAVATAGSTGVVTGIASGMTYISYKLSSGCTTAVVVTVNALPAVITGTAVVCQGATTTLADAVIGGTWASSDNTTATVGATGIVTGAAAGMATITYTTGSGCTTTKTVTVNALPARIAGTGSICIGTSLALADATGGGIWSSSSSAVSVTAATGSVVGVASGNAVISYTLPTGCRTTTIVTVNVLPAAITGTTNVCPGLNITLSDATAGGTWSATGTAAFVDAATGVVTGLTAGTASITYASGPGCMRTTTITVNVAPTAILGTPVLYTGSTTTLSDAITPGIGWTSSTITIATVGAGNGIVTGIAAGTATITYKAATGCVTTTVVTINALPAAIVGTSKLCIGSTTSLTDATAGGTWTSSNNAVATIDATSGVVSAIAAGNSTITYTLSGGGIRTAIVTVVATPAAITGNMLVCVGTATTLADINLGGTWATGSAAIATINISNGIITGVAAGITSMTYTLSGCSVATVISVNPFPTANIVAANTVCSGNTITLTNAMPGGTWSSINYAVASVGATTGVITGVAAGTVTISYSFGGTCRVGTTITVNGIPAAITGTADICAGSTTVLNDAVSGGTWVSSAPAVATVGSASHIVTGVTAGTATISYTSGSGCTATTVVTVDHTPGLGLMSGPSDIIIATMPTILLTNSLPGGVWSSDNTAVATVDASGNVTGITPGMATIYYTITNACGSNYSARTETVLATGSRSANTTAVVTGTGADAVAIYPNPNKGDFMVKGSLATSTSDATIEITDMLGQVVYKNKVTAQDGQINEHVQLGNNLANGMYLLNISAGGEARTLHFMLGK